MEPSPQVQDSLGFDENLKRLGEREEQGRLGWRDCCHVRGFGFRKVPV
jgi:hypothetical protein